MNWKLVHVFYTWITNAAFEVLHTAAANTVATTTTTTNIAIHAMVAK
jgi:hypothetical protein